MMRSWRQIEPWVAWGGAVLIALFLLMALGAWGYDDPYITYRYSENIAAGNGFVYNLGDRSLSTTTPLYALILALFRIARISVWVVSPVIGALSLALTGMAFWHLGQIWATPVAAWIGLVTLPLFPLLAMTLGSETPLTLALVLWGIVVYAQRRYTLSAVWLALAILCRADSVLVLPLLAAHHLFSHRHERGVGKDGEEDAGEDAGPRELIPWKAVGVGAFILLLWFGFAWIYFGTPLPVTLAAKRAQGLMRISESYWQGIGLLIGQYWSSPPLRLPMILSVVGLAWAMRRRSWLLVLAWSGAHLGAYVALGVTRYYWYYAQLVPGIVAALALGGEALTLGAERLAGQRARWILAVLLVVGLAGIEANLVWQIGQKPDPRLIAYRDTGAWIAHNTPQDATVGALEVGIIGYYAQRTMIDFAGLLQPEVAHVFALDTTYEDSARFAIDRFRPDYLALQDGQLPGVQYAPLVADACSEVHRLDPNDYPARLLILHCQWP